jgi:hypothetical protein
MTWRDLADIGAAAAAVASSAVAYSASRASRRAANIAHRTAMHLSSVVREQNFTRRPPWRPGTPPRPWGTHGPTLPAPGGPWVSNLPPYLAAHYCRKGGRDIQDPRWRAAPGDDMGRCRYEVKGKTPDGQQFNANGVIDRGVVIELGATVGASEPAWGMDTTQPMPIVAQPRKGDDE